MFDFRVQAVVQDAILGLREELSTLQKMKGLTSDEKGTLSCFSYYFISHQYYYVDPEEFLNLLFKHVLHVEPFLHIK